MILCVIKFPYICHTCLIEGWTAVLELVWLPTLLDSIAFLPSLWTNSGIVDVPLQKPLLRKISVTKASYDSFVLSKQVWHPFPNRYSHFVPKDGNFQLLRPTSHTHVTPLLYDHCSVLYFTPLTQLLCTVKRETQTFLKRHLSRSTVCIKL